MMKRLFVLLLAAWILCGCAAQSPVPEPELPVPATQAAEQSSLPVSLHDPGSALQTDTMGAVRVFPLGITGATNLYPMGKELILLQETGSGSTLYKLTGPDWHWNGQVSPGFPGTSEDAPLQVFPWGLAWFDPATLQTVVLDTGLAETMRLSAPADTAGAPLLSEDAATLYYCTDSDIRALDLNSGISRLLKQSSSRQQRIHAVWSQQGILRCNLLDRGSKEQALFLSTENGRILRETNGAMEISLFEDTYYAQYDSGNTTNLLFGRLGEDPQMLFPAVPNSTCQFLPELHGAVTISREPGTAAQQIGYYDLDTGLLASSFTLPGTASVTAITAPENGPVCILAYDEAYGCDVLLCWDPAVLPSGNHTVYTGSYYTRENPDYEGLAACKLYAEQIGSRYGLEILTYKDAVANPPWDYTLEYEHQASVLNHQLTQIEEQLSHYPPSFWESLKAHFPSIRLCLVHSITGSPDAPGLDSANGLQFWDGSCAYIILTTGDNPSGLYHELSHLIDTVVLSKSTAYDQWENWNPDDFSYLYSYTQVPPEEYQVYLQEDNRVFIDSYSMHFPSEDRARILEYAMTPGNAHYFQSVTMQSKLLQICTGIRQAFRLKKSPETFLWEQYLNTSLVYSE